MGAWIFEQTGAPVRGAGLSEGGTQRCGSRAGIQVPDVPKKSENRPADRHARLALEPVPFLGSFDRSLDHLRSLRG